LGTGAGAASVRVAASAEMKRVWNCILKLARVNWERDKLLPALRTNWCLRRVVELMVG
jgi:hypothetical protein